MKLPVAIAAHKAQFALAGAGGAVLLGVRAAAARKSAATSSTTPGTSATYDSTAWDLYNSIQPQLDALGRQIANLTGGPSDPHDALDPAKPPSAPPPPTDSGLPDPHRELWPRFGITLPLAPPNPQSDAGRAAIDTITKDVAAHPGGGNWWASNPDANVVAWEEVLSAANAGHPVQSYGQAETPSGVKYNRVVY